ncbi:MAG: RNA methyltransferase [Halanaerobiaceae bacterium]|nr:RNA methyltransferase [Halanaerobiaceae bacterium]
MGRIDVEVFLGLIHYPIRNKQGEIITTTVTNLDLHDIARVGRTYNINKYFVIHPIKSQQALVRRMKKYWTSEYGAKYIPNRSEAFSVLEIVSSLEESLGIIREICGKEPYLVATDAKQFSNSVSYREMREVMFNTDRPIYLIFGTGWGLTEEMVESCDYILEPVWGRGDFNHLSVRSAASIILDRLLAEEWWNEK